MESRFVPSTGSPSRCSCPSARLCAGVRVCSPTYTHTRTPPTHTQNSLVITFVQVTPSAPAASHWPQVIMFRADSHSHCADLTAVILYEITHALLFILERERHLCDSGTEMGQEYMAIYVGDCPSHLHPLVQLTSPTFCQCKFWGTFQTVTT